MKRYRSRGGFRCLMRIPCWLAAVRIVLTAFSALLLPVPEATPALGIVPAASVIIIKCAECLMMHRCGLAGRASRTLEIIADECFILALCACLGLRFPRMRIPAGILGLLSLPGMTGRLVRLHQQLRPHRRQQPAL